MNFNSLLQYLDNEYVKIGLGVFLALYGAGISRVELPPSIKNLFNNNIFKVVWLSLLLILNFNKMPHVALTVALVLVLTLHQINKQEIKENFAYLEYYQK